MKSLFFGLLPLFAALTLSGAGFQQETFDKYTLQELPYEVCAIPPGEKEAEAFGVMPTSARGAKALYDKGAAFYDARRMAHYSKGHVKNALPIRFDSAIGEYVLVKLPEDKTAPVVFYCYGPECASSFEAAKAVADKGYTKVYWLLEGYHAWKKAGYPTE